MNENLKLYTVKVIREAYVLAEDADEAESLINEIERWEDPIVRVGDGSEILDGWDAEAKIALVYHNRREDITLADARLTYGVGIPEKETY